MILFTRKRRKKDNVRRMLLSTASSARAAALRIENMIQKLKVRREKLFKLVTNYLSQGYKDVAAFYSREVLQIDKMIEELTKIQVALERVAIRAETIAITGIAVGYVSELKKVIRELKKSIGGIIPEVSIALSEVEEKLESVAIELNVQVNNASGSSVTIVNGEAEKILKEAEEIARLRLEESVHKEMQLSSS